MILDLALAGIQASNAAYELDSVKRLALLTGFGLVEDHYCTGKRDARALICHNSDNLSILAIQGTQFTKGEIPTIMANVKVAPVPIGNIGSEVHQGYWEMVQSLLPALPSNLIVDLLTGHSEGGAMANLIISKIKAKYLYTFGAPKSANGIFWKNASLQPERFVNERDFAPVWPYLPDEWEQPGLQWWMHDAGNEAATNLVLQQLSVRPVMPDSISNHDPLDYLARVTALWGAEL